MSIGGGGGLLYKDTAARSFFSEMMRDHYQPGVIRTLNNKNFLMDYLPGERPRFEGKLAVWGAHTGRSAGHAAIGPGGKLPDPDKQKYNRWRVPMRNHYGRIQFDDISDEASATEIAAFINGLDMEITGMVDDMARQQNRMLHLDGSGRLAETTTVGAGTVETIVLPQIPESPGTMVGMPPTYFLHEGMRILFLQADGTSPDAGVIASVDSDTQITLAASITTAANDWLVLNTEDANTDTNSSGWKREPLGMAAHFSDTNPDAYDATDQTGFGLPAPGTHYQGIDADTVANAFARANILDGGGVNRAPTESLIQGALTRHRKVNNGMVSFMMSSLEMQDAYGSQLLTDRRFNNTMTLSGGWIAVDYGGNPWVTDRDCLPNRIYIADSSVLVKGSLSQYKWIDRDGSVFHRLENYDSFQSTFRGRWNTAVKVRNRLTLLAELSEA